MLHPPIRVVAAFAVPLAGAILVTGLAVSATPEAPTATLEAPRASDDAQESLAEPAIFADDIDTAVEEIKDSPSELGPEQFSFVIRVAGKSYIRLSDDKVSPRAKAKLVAEDGVQTAIAPLEFREAPEDLWNWNQREVIVGGTCHTHVVAFVQLAQLTGDPGYAGDDKPWTAASVMAHGSPIIAGRLAGCDGTWARDASESPAVIGEKLTDTALVAAARVDLFAGELANQTQAEWRAAKLDGDWRTEVPIASLVARHPVTNERWVVLHAKRGGGCGDHEVNILAAYRANDDGTVTRISAQNVDLDSIQQLVDIDGDGKFEVIGTQAWGLNRVFIDLRGNSLSTLPLQFYGCPC